LRLLEQPEEATKLSRAGHEFVKENYDWGEMTRPLLDLIERQ
jgi:hypothetical protein